MFCRWLSNLPEEKYKSDRLSSQSLTSAKLEEMFDSANYSDVTLQCEGNDIKCHRNILSFYSPVLDRLFLGEFQEKGSRSIEIKEVRCDVLTKAIHFIYGKGLALTSKCVMDLLAFSDMYDIAVLREVCSDMLVKNITPAIVVTLWQWGKKYNARKIIEACSDYCAAEFGFERHHIIKTSGFLEAEKDIIVELLSSRFLYVEDEEEVFNALLDWVLYDADARADDLDELLSKCVNVQHLTSQCVMNRIIYLTVDERVIREKLLDLAQKISTGRVSPMTVCSRLNAKFIDVLQWSVCLRHGARSAASMPLYHLYQYALNFATSPSTTTEVDDLVDRAVHWPFAHTGRTIAELFVVDSKIIACTMSPEKVIIAEAEQQIAKIFQIPDNCSLHFHQLPDGKVLFLAASDRHQLVKVNKLADVGTFVTEYETVTPDLGLSPDCLRLSVHYSGFIFVFEIYKDSVYVFDTSNGRYVGSLPLPIPQNEWYHLIASSGNVACLLSMEDDIVVVMLDELLARLMRSMRRRQSSSPGVKRRRLDDDDCGRSAARACDVTDAASGDAPSQIIEKRQSPARSNTAESSDASNPDVAVKHLKLTRQNDKDEESISTAAAAVFYLGRLFIARKSYVVQGELTLVSIDVAQLLSCQSGDVVSIEFQYKVKLNNVVANYMQSDNLYNMRMELSSTRVLNPYRGDIEVMYDDVAETLT